MAIGDWLLGTVVIGDWLLLGIMVMIVWSFGAMAIGDWLLGTMVINDGSLGSNQAIVKVCHNMARFVARVFF